MQPFARPLSAVPKELFSIAAIFSKANTCSLQPDFSPSSKGHQCAIMSLAPDQATQSVEQPRPDETPGIEGRASGGAGLGSHKPIIEIERKIRN
jgi:hypothetical protein